MTETPLKDKKGKSRVDLIIPEFILQIGFILEFGAQKYKENSWQGIDTKDHYAAAMRHMLKWKQGEKIDPESGMHHIIHAATNMMFIFHNEKINEK